MPSITQCPECQGQLQVPDEFLGRKVKCPTCSAQFTAGGTSASAPAPAAPAPRQPAYDDYDDEDDDYDDRPRRRRRRRGEPHRGTTVLVMGVLSVVLGGLGMILGPIAWTMGNNDLRKIRGGEMDPEGEGLTKAGRICGIVGTFLGICNCVGAIVYFIFLFNMQQGGRIRF